MSEVIRLANVDGPQVVTCRGVERAVVLSAEEYRKLASEKPTFVDLLLDGPKLDDEGDQPDQSALARSRMESEVLTSW